MSEVWQMFLFGCFCGTCFGAFMVGGIWANHHYDEWERRNRR